MRLLGRFASVSVALLLLAAPVATACEGMDEGSGPCPMMEAIGGDMASSMASTGEAPCHGADSLSDDCCDFRAMPDQAPALRLEAATALGALPLTALRMPSPRREVPSSVFDTADAFRLHGLGRYTLFSSLLL